LLDIFTVGAGAPSGFPFPVVNMMICAPAAVSAVCATISFPEASRRFNLVLKQVIFLGVKI
jgi:hypothetical protein